VSTEGRRLQQISDLLAQRGVSAPVLEAVVASGGAATAAWGVSSLSQRLELLTPVKHGALAAVAPNSQLPTNLPAKGYLRYALDGSEVAVALLSVETQAAREIVDKLVPPGATRSAWYAVMDRLPTGGAILNHLRYLTEQRWAISNTYIARDAAAQDDFVRQTGSLLEHLEIPADQAALRDRSGSGHRSRADPHGERRVGPPPPQLLPVHRHRVGPSDRPRQARRPRSGHRHRVDVWFAFGRPED
jgi:hypothetical protein